MPTLLEETERLLVALPRWVTLTQVSHDTGVKLSWLSAFASGKISDPGIKKIQTLYNYLSILPVTRKPVEIEFRSFRELPPNEAGVYEIWAGETCLYVGASCNLQNRLKNHFYSILFSEHKDTAIVKITWFPPFSFTEFNEARKQTYAFERLKIKTLRPLYNQSGNEANV